MALADSSFPRLGHSTLGVREWCVCMSCISISLPSRTAAFSTPPSHDREPVPNHCGSNWGAPVSFLPARLRCASGFVYKRMAGYPHPNRDLRFYGGKPVLALDLLQVGCPRLARSTANHWSSPSPSLGTTILDSLGKRRIQRDPGQDYSPPAHTHRQQPSYDGSS